MQPGTKPEDMKVPGPGKYFYSILIKVFEQLEDKRWGATGLENIEGCHQ